VCKPSMWECMCANICVLFARTRVRRFYINFYKYFRLLWAFKNKTSLTTANWQVLETNKINGTYKPVIFRPPQMGRPTVAVTIPTEVLRHASLPSVPSTQHQQKNSSFPVRTIIFVQNTPSLFPAEKKASVVSSTQHITLCGNQ